MRSLFGCLAVSACLVLFVKSAPARGDGVLVNPGWDLLQTVEGTQFYGIPLEGVPLGQYDFGGSTGVRGVGLTDTIMQRLDQAVAPSLPGTAPTIDVQMDALQLVTVAPTDLGAGPGYYYVTLQSVRGGPTSTGTMDISFNNDGSGGTFTSALDVYYDIRYGALNGPIVQSADLLLSSSSPVDWARAAPDPNDVRIPQVDELLNNVDTSTDFWPGSAFQETHEEELAVHKVIPAVPEPASLSLLMVGFFGLMSRRRRAA